MSEWISVDLLTPEHDSDVIVSSGDDVCVATFRECDDGSYYFDAAVNITHWMELPEPPC